MTTLPLTPRSPASRPNLLIILVTVLTFCSTACDRTPAAPPQLPPDAIWLETGNAPGQVVYPRAIAYDTVNDWIYVVDRQARIQRFDSTGKRLAGWSMPDFAQGKPVGLSVGPDGNLWVPDTHYHRVIVYSPTGTEIRRFGSRGSEPGQFIYPTDIAFDPPTNRVFVAEYGDNDRIQVFSPDGTFLYQFGSFGQAPGQFSRPQSIAILSNELFLTDACNHRLQVFSLDGKFLRVIGSVGDAPGQFRFPYGLEPDPDGNLLVTEFGNNRVQRLTPQGKPLATWGTPGRLPGELAHPWAATTNNRRQTLIIDSGNNRIQLVRF